MAIFQDTAALQRSQRQTVPFDARLDGLTLRVRETVIATYFHQHRLCKHHSGNGRATACLNSQLRTSSKRIRYKNWELEV